MDTAVWRLVEQHVAEQVLPLKRRIAELEAHVRRLQAALAWHSGGGPEKSSSTNMDNKSHDVISERMSDDPHDVPASIAIALSENPMLSGQTLGFTVLSDEAFSLVLSYLALRSPFTLQQCSRPLRYDFRSRGNLIWTCVSEFVCVQMLRYDRSSSDAHSLYQWASRNAQHVFASEDDGSSLTSPEGQSTYEISLVGDVALSISMAHLAKVRLAAEAAVIATREQHSSAGIGTLSQGSSHVVNIISDVLESAECRLCKRSSTGYRSADAGGHTNRYEAEFVIPICNASANQFRMGILVTKYYSEGDCGWDEGLDVNCYVDGREILHLHRDGSDAEYDAQSVNKGLLYQLATQMCVPAPESMLALKILWQILCAPLLACDCWDEEKPRLGLGLPHRQDDPSVFRTLGAMFAKLAASVAGSDPSCVVFGKSQDGYEISDRFLSCVLGV